MILYFTILLYFTLFSFVKSHWNWVDIYYEITWKQDIIRFYVFGNSCLIYCPNDVFNVNLLYFCWVVYRLILIVSKQVRKPVNSWAQTLLQYSSSLRLLLKLLANLDYSVSWATACDIFHLDYCCLIIDSIFFQKTIDSRKLFAAVIL